MGWCGVLILRGLSIRIFHKFLTHYDDITCEEDSYYSLWQCFSPTVGNLMYMYTHTPLFHICLLHSDIGVRYIEYCHWLWWVILVVRET